MNRLVSDEDFLFNNQPFAHYEANNTINLLLSLAFVDYNKTFDTLEHIYIWRSLVEQMIKHKYIRIIRTIYAGTATTSLEKSGRSFPIQRGVKQVNPLRPKRFGIMFPHLGF